MRIYAAGAIALAFLMAGPAHAADANNGKAIFSRCAACHSAAKEGPNMIGPNLYGIVGRKAATKSGYSYSTAMKNSGIPWTDQRLNAYLARPQQIVPGTRM